MKSLLLGTLLVSNATLIHAQINADAQPQGTPYAIASRDANSRVWQRTNWTEDASGEWVPHVHSYTELATGLNYKDPQTGEWRETKEEINVLPDGSAQAIHGQHSVHFPVDIYTGVIEVVTPDGEHIRARPVGISYFDGTNRVLIAELTNSVGQIISSNQVVYTNVFNGLAADLVCTYRKGGFESDLVLRSQPPLPEAIGLNQESTQIELLTEFINTPEPRQTRGTAGSPDRLSDSMLQFGAMKMVRGKAFQIGGQDSARGGPDIDIAVSKTWTHIDGRTFLIEAIPARRAVPKLEILPLTEASIPSIELKDRLLHRVQLPPARPAHSSDKSFRLAKLDLSTKPGLVLDYNIVDSTLTNMTFQGDTTYFVTAPVSLEGNTTVEGGTVIKYLQTNSVCGLFEYGTATCLTSPYRPAIFTSVDDNTVGETIPGSTGNPVIDDQNYYFSPWSNTNVALHDFRMSYCYSGIYIVDTPQVDVHDIQFVHTAWPFGVVTSTANSCQGSLRNVLMSDVTASALEDGYVNLDVEHLTVDECSQFSYNDYGANLSLTNCLLVGIQNMGDIPYTTNCVAFATTNAGIFQSVGAGSYYLGTNSIYRNEGTTNINPELLAELSQKTTYPPMLYSNVVFSNNLTLNPQAQRDYDTPDLGYHYDPIDYLVDQFSITNATLSVTNGTVIAGYNDQDVIVTDGSSIISIGTPPAPNWFTRYSCVQEQPLLLGTTNNPPIMVNPWHAINAPSGLFRFTKFSCLAAGGYHLVNTQIHNAYSNLFVQDCEFWGGTNDFSGYNNTVVVLKNNLFARSGIWTASSSYTNNNLAVSNNLFWNMSFSVWPLVNSNTWFFFNNDFDNCSLSFGRNPAAQQPVNGYNAYLVNTNRLNPPNAFDIVTNSDIAYEAGPLGTFYQPTDSILIDHGNTNANLVGLFWYTTKIQGHERGGVVDIGYHYVALDANGNPIDSDGDGIPNYIEDSNGDGVYDAGDLSDLNDYYNGVLPNLAIVNGNNQVGTVNKVLPVPLTISITGTNGLILTNAPITFAVTQGGAQVSTVENGSFSPSVMVRTGTNGRAAVYLLLPSTFDTTNLVTATAQSESQSVQVTFTEITYGPFIGWGSDSNGETSPPGVFTNVISLAAGEGHGIVALDNGSVSNWGSYWTGTSFIAVTAPPGLTNALAVAAGSRHDLVLLANGTVVAWGLNDFLQTNVPPNLTNGVAIAADEQQNLALLQNGTVVQWGQTNAPIPAGLSNVAAIATGTNFCLALLSNTTVVAWGNDSYGQTNIPTSLSNVVAIAAGGAHALALEQNGTVIAWGDNAAGETNVPPGLSNVMGIAAGDAHCLALLNNGTVVAWGDDTFGETNVPVGLGDVKLIAGGGNFSLVSEFSPLVMYPVNVSQDLLLIYNTDSIASTIVENYYVQNRPLVSGANVLGISCTSNETILPGDFTNSFIPQIQSWLAANPTKRPQYVILFNQMPSRINTNAAPGSYPFSGMEPSVQYQINSGVCSPTWNPFVTSLDMNGFGDTSNCTNYINKLATIGVLVSSNSPILSASAGSYGNTNFVLDDIRNGGPSPQYEDFASASYDSLVAQATNGLLSAGVSMNSILFYDGLVISNILTTAPPHATGVTNVAGYMSWGVHGDLPGTYPIDDRSVVWYGNSGWWLIETVESYNGFWTPGQGNITEWFSSNAFGGPNYSNTPIGAVSHTDEPFGAVNNSAVYFGLWASRKNFAICAWNSRNTTNFQAVGDPFVTR